MRILFVSSSSGSRGGGETFLVYLGKALARRGHKVMLWVSDHGRMNEVAGRFEAFGTVQRAEYVNTYDRPRRSLDTFLDGTTPRRVAREWKALKPDIVHLNKQNLEDGLDLLRGLRLLKCPTLCTIHMTQSAAYLGAKQAWLRDWVSRWVLRGYRSPMVTVSEPRKTDLEKFLGRRKGIVAISNGVPIPPAMPEADRNRRRAELGLAEGNLAILAVGRMTAQKRPLRFLDLAEKIHTRVPEAKFLWIGDGPVAAEWDARAASGGFGARRLGWRQDVPELLASGDLLLHTAEYEGMPLAVLEAMAAGLPCAVSEGLYREMPFLDEGNSFRVPEEGDAWMEALRDRGEIARRAKAAGQLAAASFSTETMAAAYERLYVECTGGGGTGRS